jgi:hypothetical protein
MVINCHARCRSSDGTSKPALKHLLGKMTDRKESKKEGSQWVKSVQDVSIFWPADFLSKDIENIRILTYGYDSHVTKFFGGAATQTNIYILGRTFLQDLEVIRRSKVGETL